MPESISNLYATIMLIELYILSFVVCVCVCVRYVVPDSERQKLHKYALDTVEPVTSYCNLDYLMGITIF